MQSDVLSPLLEPRHLYSRQEVLTTACVPCSPGLCCWYFREVPPLVPTDGCVVRNGLTLLYAGIAPKAPPKNGTPASQRILWHRVRYHMRGNAYVSPLCASPWLPACGAPWNRAASGRQWKAPDVRRSLVWKPHARAVEYPEEVDDALSARGAIDRRSGVFLLTSYDFPKAMRKSLQTTNTTRISIANSDADQNAGLVRDRGRCDHVALRPGRVQPVRFAPGRWA